MKLPTDTSEDKADVDQSQCLSETLGGRRPLATLIPICHGRGSRERTSSGASSITCRRR